MHSFFYTNVDLQKVALKQERIMPFLEWLEEDP